MGWSSTKSSRLTDEIGVCYDSFGLSSFCSDFFLALWSMSMDRLTAVKALVVLAVKNNVSGVTGISGSTATP
jgi:hypothetical protein